MNTLLEKLESLEARFHEVGTLIADPSVIADQGRYVRLTKEYKDLETLDNLRRQYAATLSGIDESRHILLNENDAELKEMARDDSLRSNTDCPNSNRPSNSASCPVTPKTPKTPYSRYAVAQAATRQHYSQATFFACMPNIAKAADGNCKYPVQARELPEVLKKSFAPSAAPMCMAHSNTRAAFTVFNAYRPPRPKAASTLRQPLWQCSPKPKPST